MTTFYICRHGQTENNKNQRLSGWTDTPLTDEGVENALSSAKKLHGVRFDKVLSSDLGRAFTTAYIILRELGDTTEIERSKELREVNYGDLAHQPYSAYPKVTPQENTNFVVPGGESLAQMQQRVMAFIQSLSAENPGKTILLVAHQGTVNAVRASGTGQEIGVADLTHNAHNFVAKFVYNNGKVTSFSEVSL